MSNNDKVLILTPVKDAEDHLNTYFRNLKQVTYPSNLISVGLLESDSRDNTFRILKKKIPDLQKTFHSVRIWKKDFGFQVPDGTPRWAGMIQRERRSVLARSRNQLLFKALGDEEWVLWMDVDLVEYPPDIIQRLLAVKKDIVHPHCVTEYGGRTFDRNSWRDKGRKHLDDLRKEGDLAELHSVGGSMLLIKADLHRDGLVFPPFLYGRKNKRIRRTQFFFANWKEKILGFPNMLKKVLSGQYQGEIETEGLGVMAHDMGYTCWGMPNLEIKHKRE